MLSPLFLHTPRRFWDSPCPAPLPEHPGVQGEVKPSLILPAVAKGGCAFYSPIFFLILAVFQVFSPQHRVTSTRGGLLGLVRTPGAPWPFRIALHPQMQPLLLPGKASPSRAVPVPCEPCRECRSPLLRLLLPRLLFSFPRSWGKWGGLEATSTTTEFRLGSGATRPDRTPLVSPAQTLPWSAVPRFKANPDGKGAAGGGKTPSAANRGRRKPSSLTPSWSHPPFYSYPPGLLFFLFSANALNTQVVSSAQSPFDTLMYVYIFI